MIPETMLRIAPPSIKSRYIPADPAPYGWPRPDWWPHEHAEAAERSIQTTANFQVASNCASRRWRHVGDLATAVLLVLLLVVMLAGCERATARTAEVVVVLGSGTRNEPDPELALTDLAILRRAATESADATAYVVNPNTGEPDEVPLTPRRPDGQVDYGPDRDQVLVGNLNHIQRLVRRDTANTPFDLIAFIAKAVQVSPTPGTLIVVSSGLSTSGAFDLRQVGWGANPRSIAAQLKRRGFLPNLAGWHVVLSNLAATTAPQPALPLLQRAELTSYWLAICRAAGAASCRTDLVTRPESPSHSAAPVPVVPVPVVTSVHGPHGWTGQNIPVDTFFAFNSARLLPGADLILGPLVAKAVARRLKVSIAGYSSPDGGSATYNTALSRHRAMAIRARLIALGVPAYHIVKVSGYGTAGKTIADCYRVGRLDEAICANLRRVVILLSPIPAATF